MKRVKVPYKNVVIEPVNDIGSVALGIYFNYGSSNENSRFSGYSHFFEHMLFKGTKTRTSKDISSIVESVGGYINGYTNHNRVAVVSKIPKFAVESVLDLYKDILNNSRFTNSDIEIEKKVVIEEINSAKDEPEDYLYESYMKTFWKNTPHSKPIAGSVENVSNITRESFLEFVDIIFNRQRVLSIAGNMDEISDETALSDIASKNVFVKEKEENLQFITGEKIENFTTVQSHNLMGTMLKTDNNLYKKMIIYFINTIFMEGMSSIFFQILREQSGLVYDIYPVLEDLGDYTNYSIYFSSKKENRDNVIEKIFNEYKKYLESGFSNELLDYFKKFYKGNLLLNLENSYNRMSLNAQDFLRYGKAITFEERFELLDRLSLDDINSYFQQNFKKDNFSIYSLMPQ